MIWLYSGTPGSGKSLHAATDIYKRLRREGGLICNFPVNEEYVAKGKGRFLYVDNSDLTVDLLKRYARKYHRLGVEGQSLVVIDECQIIFNSREYARKDRKEWISFFSQHRKYGYNIILIAQNDRMIDRQIRALIEYEVRHRKLSHYGVIGSIITLFSFGRPWFAAIEYWYGGNRLKLNTELFMYKKKVARIYDSYKLFDAPEDTEASSPDKLLDRAAETGAGGARSAGGSRDMAPPPAERPGDERESVVTAAPAVYVPRRKSWPVCLVSVWRRVARWLLVQTYLLQDWNLEGRTGKAAVVQDAGNSG